MADGSPTVTWTKAHFKDAIQAIEDKMRTDGIPALSAAINAATAPFTFSAAQKAKLFRVWCDLHFREG